MEPVTVTHVASTAVQQQHHTTHAQARRTVAAQNLQLQQQLHITTEQLDDIKRRMDGQAGQKRVYRSRLQEACDEIEQLRAENAALQERLQADSSNDSVKNTNTDGPPLQGTVINLKESNKV